MSPRLALAWIAVGIATLDVAPALFAYAWFEAAIGGIPFAAPWPPAFLVVAAIAALTLLVDWAIWRTATRTMRGLGLGLDGAPWGRR